MHWDIAPIADGHLDAVVDLSLRAWAPVFVSIRDTLEPAVYEAFYPDGWRGVQAEAVREACTSSEMQTWVAVGGGIAIGFVTVKLHSDYGEIHMLAVDPEAQRRGVGVGLSEFALNWMREQGVLVAMVETGGDPGHGPARRTYEKAGFRLMPVARYFKKL